MKNRLFDIITGKEKKIYNEIIKLIDQKKYNALFELDKEIYYEDEKFGLSNQKYIDMIFKRLEEEALNDTEFLVQMNQSSYHRANYFNEFVIKSKPEKIEIFINNSLSLFNIEKLLLIALDNGYLPSEEYLSNHTYTFFNVEVMKKMISNGYRPKEEIIEKYTKVFSDEEIFLKIMSFGYVPSVKFINETKILNNPNLVDRIFDVIDLPEVINSLDISGNENIQKKIIKEKPFLILKINNSSTFFEQIWLESFKQGYIPEEILNMPSITNNFLLFSRIIKQHPEMIKYCKIYDKELKNRIDELALCMGYIPSLQDVQNSEYIKKSLKLMHALILRRPEAIKYIEESYSEISLNEFWDLARLSLDNGYIPTVNDIEYNPKLIDSFDIMKVLIQEKPNLISMIKIATPKKEELLKIAIENGYNGNILGCCDEILYTETAIMYRLDRGENLSDIIKHGDGYSVKLYDYLINKGYQVSDIINFFVCNYETMKKIISSNPEYINLLSQSLSRKEIDELSFLAIEKGYNPKFNDEIFGHGEEIVKYMVQKYPAYLEKIQPHATLFGKAAIADSLWLEVCKIAYDAGFMPDIATMGNGWGGATKTEYNSCYDIMKTAIPQNPVLIESCTVSDKKQYDELCKLAIYHGYKVNSEYALSHWGQKMRTNYDLMAQYVSDNPNFLSEVEMSTSDEMKKLIDISIKSGLNLKYIDENILYKIFLKVDEEVWPEYLDSYTIEKINKVKNLYLNNDEISETINPRFLNDDIAKHFTKNQIEILSCYPKIQEKIIKIFYESTKISIIYEIVKKYKDNLEWIPILEKTLDNINSFEYANLISSIENKELTQEEKDNLIYLLMTNNHLDISNYDELKNIDSIRDNYIKMLIERNTLGSLKTAYFERTFGIDLSTAINLVNLYGKSLESSTIDTLDEKIKSEFIILDNMKKIINLNNIDILKYYVENVNPNFVVKPDLMITYEARLKYLFTQEFNKSFTKPLEEDRVVSNIDGEQDLDIYLAAGHDGNKKCRMMITSIGAYTNMSEPDDYYASWNVDKIASHGCCCSYVGEKNLGTAGIKYCCLGFTDYELGSLQLSGPYDLCSVSSKDSYQIDASFSSMFLLPDDVLNYTRHTHNETVWERRNISNEVIFKKQPSYIVYFVDNFDDRLSNPEAMRQWESVKRASINFSNEVNGTKIPLPIMVVEREKIAQSQINIIQNKLNEFKTTLDANLIKEIISDYESNYAGNRTFHVNISEKYFPSHEQLSESVVGEIIATIEKIYVTHPSSAIECIYELEKAVRSEKEKYDNTKHGVGQSFSSFNIEEALIKINELKSLFRIGMDSTLSVISDSVDNKRQYEKSDVPNIDKKFIDSQLSAYNVACLLNESGLSDLIALYENEIKLERINDKLKIHGQRHVKNVLLYSAIIGKNIVKNEHELYLIMLSAKYHDIGRKTDAYDAHAEESAKIAIEKLKDRCSKEDLAIISTIIEFHEVPREGDYVDDLFVKIARKNNIPKEQIPRIRQLAEVLKDADALDRTRFINRARINPEYLKYSFSKLLIKFAASIQETYAINDLKEFHCDDSINILIHRYTPQEILRTIRHSTRGYLRIEDIQSFIKSWADMHENEELNSKLTEDVIEKDVEVKYGK